MRVLFLAAGVAMVAGAAHAEPRACFGGSLAYLTSPAAQDGSLPPGDRQVQVAASIAKQCEDGDIIDLPGADLIVVELLCDFAKPLYAAPNGRLVCSLRNKGIRGR